MSWMTPAPLPTVPGARWPPPGRLSADTARPGDAGGRDGVVAEQLLEPVPALLHPVQRQPEIGDRVPDRVERGLIGQLDGEPAAVHYHGQPAPRQFRLQLADAVLDLDQQYPARLG